MDGGVQEMTELKDKFEIAKMFLEAKTAFLAKDAKALVFATDNLLKKLEENTTDIPQKDVDKIMYYKMKAREDRKSVV